MPPPTSRPSRILLVRPSALGDVCRSVHVVVRLRQAFPRARIDWLVQDGFQDAVRHHPDLSGVMTFPRGRLGAQLRRFQTRETRDFLARLRAGRYDMVVDAQGLLRSAFFGFATGAPLRVGYRNAQEGGANFYTRRLEVPEHLHTVDRMDRLAKFACDEALDDPRQRFRGVTSRPRQGAGPLAAAMLGIGVEEDLPNLRLYADPDEIDAVQTELPLGDEEPIIVAPTSRWSGKRWPIDRFTEVVRKLVERRHGPVVIVGGPNEREQCAPLLEFASIKRNGGSPPVIDLVGKTSVARLMALISTSRLVIANDSAALHMAVGFDVPTVALFGPTDTRRVGPYGRDDEVIQHLDGERLRPGDHKNEELGRSLMDRIRVGEVMERVEHVLRLGPIGSITRTPFTARAAKSPA